jgi:heme-degrading monooxygenase HmoA
MNEKTSSPAPTGPPPRTVQQQQPPSTKPRTDYPYILTYACGNLRAVSNETFTYMWEYRVPPENADQFRQLYGSQGAWVQLFERAAGFIETTLYRDRRDPLRYVTVDRWESEAAFTEFRSASAAEFDRLDRAGERLTLDEKPLGEFGPTP